MIDFTQYGILLILTLTLIMHICILLKIIPYQAVWGGRLKNDNDMYKFEITSIVITIILIFFMLAVTDIISTPISQKVKTIGLFVMAILFFINTIGNLVSKNKIERIFFTPITILLSLFSLYLGFSL